MNCIKIEIILFEDFVSKVLYFIRVNARIQCKVALFFLVFIVYLLTLFLRLRKESFFEFLITTECP